MNYARLEIPTPNRLVVGFYAALEACKAYCERPERAAKLAQELTRLVGGPVDLLFETVPGEPESSSSAPASGREAGAALREKAQHPLIRRAADLFDARPLSVEKPEG